MAEEKKRGGFGALEKRIHEMHEEDEKREQSAGGGERRTQAPRTEPGEKRPDERKKK